MLASYVSATGYSYNALKFLTMKTLLCMDMHDHDSSACAAIAVTKIIRMQKFHCTAVLATAIAI